MDRFVRTDSETLAVTALEEVLRHLRETENDTHHWLWVLHALKLCLQSFIVAGFGSAAMLEAIPPKQAEQFVNAIRNGGEYPAVRMRGFAELYEYAKSKHGWTATGKQDEAVEVLAELRNKIEHFLPGSWSLEVDLAREVAVQTVGIVEAFALRNRDYPWFDTAAEERVRSLLTEVEEGL